MIVEIFPSGLTAEMVVWADFRHLRITNVYVNVVATFSTVVECDIVVLL